MYKIFKLLFQSTGQDSDSAQIMLAIHLLLTLGYKKIVHLLKRSEHELREDEIDQNKLIDNMFNKLYKQNLKTVDFVKCILRLFMKDKKCIPRISS